MFGVSNEDDQIPGPGFGRISASDDADSSYFYDSRIRQLRKLLRIQCEHLCRVENGNFLPYTHTDRKESIEKAFEDIKEEIKTLNREEKQEAEQLKYHAKCAVEEAERRLLEVKRNYDFLR